MNISNFIVTMAQTADVEQTNLFPFPFKTHIIFCFIAVVFFIMQFFREGKPYQAIMGVAIPFSLVIWLSDSRTLFYAVGITEAVLLLLAFVTAIIFRNKNKTTAAEEAAKEFPEAAPEEEESSEQQSADNPSEEE